MAQLHKLIESIKSLSSEYNKNTNKVSGLVESLKKYLNSKVKIINSLRELAVRLVKYGAKETIVGTPKASSLPMIKEVDAEDDSPNNCLSSRKTSIRKYTTASARKIVHKPSKKQGPVLTHSGEHDEATPKRQTVRRPGTSMTPGKASHFSQTTGEQQMELIFSGKSIQKKNGRSRASFGGDFRQGSDKALDNRLNTSFALDYITQSPKHQPQPKLRRWKSLNSLLQSSISDWKKVTIDDFETVKTISSTSEIYTSLIKYKTSSANTRFVMQAARKIAGTAEKFQGNLGIMERLSSVNIAKLYHVLLERERTIYVSEYPKGTDLATKILQNGKLSEKVILEV